MAGKGGRHLATPEVRAEQELLYAAVMGAGEAGRRLAFYQRITGLDRQSVESYRELARTATGRGERWRSTYYLRKAERQLAEDEAVVAALTAWLEAQHRRAHPQLEAGYDSPAGAGDDVEAYRG